MARLVECVPNFSLSREKDETGYNALVDVANSIPGCFLFDAQSDGNHTMARLIAKYANDTATARGERYGDNDQTARELRAISYTAERNDGSETLQAFDVMTEAFRRAVDNPAMIDAWDEITSSIVENM